MDQCVHFFLCFILSHHLHFTSQTEHNSNVSNIVLNPKTEDIKMDIGVNPIGLFLVREYWQTYEGSACPTKTQFPNCWPGTSCRKANQVSATITFQIHVRKLIWPLIFLLLYLKMKICQRTFSKNVKDLGRNPIFQMIYVIMIGKLNVLVGNHGHKLHTSKLAVASFYTFHESRNFYRPFGYLSVDVWYERYWSLFRQRVWNICLDIDHVIYYVLTGATRDKLWKTFKLTAVGEELGLAAMSTQIFFVLTENQFLMLLVVVFTCLQLVCSEIRGQTLILQPFGTVGQSILLFFHPTWREIKATDFI